MKTKVAILGATGYTGIELIRYLANHPGIEITVLTSEKYAGKKIREVFPFLDNFDFPLLPVDDPMVIKKADFVFSCLPPEKSAEMVPEIVKNRKMVVDLSAAFRFKDKNVYKKWYHSHPYPQLLKKAVYGLPELFRDEIRNSMLVANPGCYPVSVLLPLVPLLRNSKIKLKGRIIVDSKSGVTGAGRNPNQELHFPEVNEGFKPYKPLAHRHQPEMEAVLGQAARKNLIVSFVPHLLPINRGILSSIYLNPSSDGDFERAVETLRKFYSAEKFVKILQANTLPNTSCLKGSNYCHIALSYNKDHKNIIIFSAIDNLGKGASGNAVQNMNIMLGIDETAGLEAKPVYP